LCGDFAAERHSVNVVDECALAVDLHDRQPFAVPRLQLRDPADVDLLEIEGHLASDLLENRTGTLAEVAALRVVQGDPSYG